MELLQILEKLRKAVRSYLPVLLQKKVQEIVFLFGKRAGSGADLLLPEDEEGDPLRQVGEARTFSGSPLMPMTAARTPLRKTGMFTPFLVPGRRPSWSTSRVSPRAMTCRPPSWTVPIRAGSVLAMTSPLSLIKLIS